MRPVAPPVRRPPLQTLLHRALRPIKEGNVVQRPFRWAAARRAPFEAGGVTVVIVSWQSDPFLQVALDAIRRFSPASTNIIVVDNHSTDGTRQRLTGRDDVWVLKLPVNLGHGLAMDIGFLHVRTEFAVSLDVDAFPFSSDWLEAALTPLREGARVAGGAADRGFAHPSFLAMRTREFIEGRHSFTARWRGELGTQGWDVGERISIRLPGQVHLIPATEVRGPGPLGTVYGGAVYHNFYAVRHLREPAGSDVALDDLVTRSDAQRAWSEATARFLGHG